MSNNIEHCETKTKTSFRIRFDAILDMDDLDIEFTGRDIAITSPVEGFELTGTYEKGYIIVDELEYHGSSSGNWYPDLETLLLASKGKISLKMVWEDGAVVILTISNGQKKEKFV